MTNSHTGFFYKQRFISTQHRVSELFHELSFKCFLVSMLHIGIIIVRHPLYLPYLCSFLDLGLFISYLYDPFFDFTFIFIMSNCIIL